MSTFVDIANWVTQDYLNRADLQAQAVNAAQSFYVVLCAKIPFDQLMITSSALPVVSGVFSYDLQAAGPTQLMPLLRAIASIKMVFSTSNARRLRRSHVRVYDSLTITNPGLVSTYARWGNAIEMNPPPDSSSYTFQVRYWSRPTLGGPSYTISNAAWSGGVTTLTITNGVSLIGNQILVSGVTPTTFNGTFNLLTASTTSLTYSQVNNPGTYTSGGTVVDNSLTTMLTPPDWDELCKWETLYRVYHYLDQQDKAMALVTPAMIPRQAAPKKVQMYETGIIPRLWNDLLTTVSQQENVDEDFSINPVIRAYSFRR